MVGLKTPPSGPRACAPTGSGVQRRADQGAAHSSRPRRRQQAARRRQKLAARSQKTIRSLRKAGDQGAGSKSRTAEATSSSCCLRYGLGRCRAKTVRPLRTAAGQGASSKPRTAKATSNACCPLHGPRHVPSHKTVRPLRIVASQGASSTLRTAEATSSLCCSRCGPRPVPSRISKTAAHSSRPRRRQHTAHHQSDEQLVLH
jgi:hypothetical protein